MTSNLSFTPPFAAISTKSKPRNPPSISPTTPPKPLSPSSKPTTAPLSLSDPTSPSISAPSNSRRRARMPADNGLTDFVRELRQHSMLTPSRERQLLEQVQELRLHQDARACLQKRLAEQVVTDAQVADFLGVSMRQFVNDRHRSLKARDELVRANLRLVVHIATLQYKGRGRDSTGVSLADLIQEGSLGLIRAAERFDLDKGGRFAPYAFRTVWGRCRRANMPVGCIVSIPDRLKVAVAKRRRGEGVGGESGELVDKAERHLKGGVWLDAPVGDGRGGCMMDMMDSGGKGPEEIVQRALVKQEIWKACCKWLSEREKMVLGMRFGLNGMDGALVKEIATKIGVSSARVGQIVWRCLDKLRECEPGLREFLQDT